MPIIWLWNLAFNGWAQSSIVNLIDNSPYKRDLNNRGFYKKESYKRGSMVS